MKVGDIVRIKPEMIDSGWAGQDYTKDMRFKIISDKEGTPLFKRLMCKLIGKDVEGYDFFPAYMVEVTDESDTL